METLGKKVKSLPTKAYLIGAIVVIVILAALSGFLFWKYASVKNDGSADTKQAEQTSKRIIGRVGEIYQLPTGEEPTVAQVQDKSKLTGQTFFEDAATGDYILVYKKAKLALLYREDIHKLINVGPINLDDQAPTDGQQPATP